MSHLLILRLNFIFTVEEVFEGFYALLVCHYYNTALLIFRYRKVLIKSFIHILGNQVYHLAPIAITVEGIECFVIAFTVGEFDIYRREAFTNEFKIENEPARSAVAVDEWVLPSNSRRKRAIRSAVVIVVLRASFSASSSLILGSIR